MNAPLAKIHAAFESFDWEAVVVAVKAGENLSEPFSRSYDWRSMFPSGVSKEQAEVLSRCNFKGVSENAGKGLMHAMCEHGETTSVANLLDIGIDPCAVGDFNQCPLVYALYGTGYDYCHVSTAVLLLERGADPNAEGLGSTGRASFVFLETLRSAFFNEGWDGVGRLWDAFSPRVDWSLRLEGEAQNSSPLVNYFLLDIAERNSSANPAARGVMWDAMRRLEAAGVSFDPKTRDKGYTTLGKYASQQQGGEAQLLMDMRKAQVCRNDLDGSSANQNVKRPNPRL